MNLDRVTSGRDVPNDINVIIEIPMNGAPHDLPELTLAQIAHFFQHYKDLEPGKWVNVQGWVGPQEAKREILDGIARFRRARKKPRF